MLNNEKKIIVFTSSGGGGHLAASSALEQYLQHDYNIQSIEVFKELLPSLDIFKYITLNRYTGETFYNLFIKKKCFRFLACFSVFGAWYIRLRRKSVYRLLKKYCESEQPALIISVIPYINDIVLEVTRELNIPFLLIPTDLDTTTYCNTITYSQYNKFYIGLPFDNHELKEMLNKKISPKNIIPIGAPLKISFFDKKNKEFLKKHYSITDNSFVIMILMGAQGSDEIKKYIVSFITIKYPIHLIVCIGKNEHIKKELEAVSLPSHISISIIGFTEHIADYMAIADMIFSKSGTLSVYEALYMNLAVFLDATSFILPWERFNHYFIEKHGFGKSIKNFDEINSLIESFITNPFLLEHYKNNVMKLEKKMCLEEVRKLIDTIIT